MNEHCFNHNYYVDALIATEGLSQVEINKFHMEASTYVPELYYVPLTVMATPVPYKPLRVNFRTRTMYVPNKKRLTKVIREMIKNQLPSYMIHHFPIFHPSLIHIMYYIPTPNNFTKREKWFAENKIIRPIVKPDNDNIEKIVLDAVKDCIIYDDAQLVDNVTSKYYSCTPRIEIVITYNKNTVSTKQIKLMEVRKQRWFAKLTEEGIYGWLPKRE